MHVVVTILRPVEDISRKRYRSQMFRNERERALVFINMEENGTSSTSRREV